MFRLNYEKKDLGPSYSIAVAVMIVMSIVLGLIFGSDASGWQFWLMQALFTLFIGGSAALYAFMTKTNLLVATKLNVKPKYAHVLWGCLAVTFLIACMTPINNVLLDGIERSGLERPSVNLESNLVGLLVVASLLPAFCEELVFRGTVAQSLVGSKSKLAALAISGGLFALYHANPAQTVHQFVLGAFLTLLVFRSGSLWTSVIAHLFNNVLVVVLSYTPLGAEEFWSFSANTGVATACLCVGIVGFAACVFGYIKTTKSVWQEVSEEKASKSSVGSLVALAVAVVVSATLWFTTLFGL